MTCSRTATHIARQIQARAVALAVAACFAPITLANPVGPIVVNGTATFATNGNTLAITNTPGSIINWQQFTINQNEITKFIQQSNQSTVLNRVTGQDPSQIFGALQSNGKVLLINPNGTVFGPSASVDVFGLIVSNLNLGNADFLANRYNFSGGGNGSVINQGSITTPVGGSVYLIGSNVTNTGIITSPKGEVLLAAGNAVTLADTGTPNMSVTINANRNQAVNLGTLDAAGGSIDIYGALINQQGMVSANSQSIDAQGRVTLKATDTTTVSGTVSATSGQGAGGQVNILGDKVQLTDTARIDVSGLGAGGMALIGGDWQGKNLTIQNATTTTVAAGATIKADATGNGNGGKVVVWSSDKTYFDGLIYARGGAAGGDGGSVETSGHTLGVTGMVNTTAPRGKAGSWLLDPAIACIADNISLCPAGGSNTTTAIVEQALGVNASLTYTADDYFKFVTTSPWVLASSAPSAGNLSISAPYINIAGSMDAFANNKNINFNFDATSGTSASFPAKSGMIDIQNGTGLRTQGMIKFNAAKTVNFSAAVDLTAPQVDVSANDYVIINSSPGGASSPAWTGPAVSPGFTNVSVTAPYISLGGTVTQYEDTAGIRFYAKGGPSATYPAKSGMIELQPGSNWTFGPISSPSTASYREVVFDASQRLVLGANTKFAPASNTTGTATVNHFFDVYFDSPVVENNGVSVASFPGSLYTHILDLHTSSVTAPINLGYGSAYAWVGPYGYTSGTGSNVLLGTDSCVATDWCTTDPGKFLTGTYSKIIVVPSDDLVNNSLGTVSVVGAFESRGKNISLTASGAVKVNSPIAIPGTLEIGSGIPADSSRAASTASQFGVTINQPVSAQSIVLTSFGGAIKLNAPLTSATGIEVKLRSSSLGSPATTVRSSFDNTAGADAMTTRDGWYIGNISGNAGSINLGGLSASGPLSFANASAKTTLLNQYASLTQYTRTSSNYLVSGSPPAIALTNDTGVSATDRITNNAALTVSSPASGATRTYSVDGGTPASTYNAPTTDGSHKVLVVDTDSAGVTVRSSISFTLINKTIAAPTVALATDSGVSPTDRITNNAALTVSPVVSGITRTYSVDGGAPAATYTVPTVNGSHTVVVTDSDIAGNSASSRLSFSLQTTTAPIAYAGTYNGTFSGNESGTWNLTISPTGEIAGTATSTISGSFQVTGLASSGNSLTFAGMSGGATYNGTVDPLTKALSGTWSATGGSGAFSGAPIANQSIAAQAASDTCATNALLCTTTATVTQGIASATADLASSTAKAQVTIDDKLKVAEAKTTDTKAADSSAKPAAPADKPAAVAAPAQPTGKAVLASAQAADARKTSVELKAEAQKATTEAKQISVEAKQAATEAKQAVAAVKVATVEAKKAETQAKAADTSARKADADVKQAEVDVKAAKTPEQKVQAETRKVQAEAKRSVAEAKKAEAEAKKPEVEAKQATAEAKQVTAEAKQAQAAAKQSEAESKQAAAQAKEAKTPEQKVAAERRADEKRVEAIQHKAVAEVKQSKADAKQAEADVHQTKADAKKSEAVAHQAEADVKHVQLDKTPAKRVEAEVKKAEIEVKKAEADVRKVQTEARKTEAEVKAAKTSEQKVAAETRHKAVESRKSEAEAKLAEHKAEAQTKKAELAKAGDRKALVDAKKSEAEAKHKTAEAKKAEAEVKVAAHERRQEARRAETARVFAKTNVREMSYDKLALLAPIRHELKTEILKPALTILEQNPKAADLPPCGADSDVCIPTKAVADMAGKQAAAMTAPKPVISFVPQIERKIAVLVGINKYADPNIPSLESAIPDAEAVAKLMQNKLGYEVRIVRDGTKADIVKAMKDVGNDVGPNDSVTVYYAGHGYMLEQGDKKVGYWIPSDATVTTPKQWLASNDIAKLLGNIPARQVLLVSDSCYSGALTQEGKVGAQGSGNVQDILSKRSVTVMSSGGEEPVSDEGKEGHSIFAWNLMNSMKNVDKYESGEHLYGEVKVGVMESFPQVPHYGAATSAGHTAGSDYLLEVRSYK